MSKSLMQSKNVHVNERGSRKEMPPLPKKIVLTLAVWLVTHDEAKSAPSTVHNL